MVRQQKHDRNSKATLNRCVFNCFLKESVYVSSWKLDRREFHALGPEY